MPEAKACSARIQSTLIAMLSLRDICELERKLSINKNKVISVYELEYSIPSNIKRDGDLDEGGEEIRNIYRGKEERRDNG